MHGGAGRGKISCGIGPLKHGPLPEQRSEGRSLESPRCRRTISLLFRRIGAVRRGATIRTGKLNGSVGRMSSRPVNRFRDRHRLINWSDIIGGCAYKTAV